MDQLRLGIAALIEEQLPVLLEHFLSRLRAELLAELGACEHGRPDPRIDQHVVAPRFPRELHLVHRAAGLVRRVSAQADRHDLVQQLHRVREPALVEAAPSRLVESVRIDLVGLDLRCRAVLRERFGEPRLLEQVLPHEDVGRRRPD